MKKTLVALAVLAAAGSVSAAEVYNNDGVSVAVSGSVEVQYIQGYETDTDKNDARLRLDDGDLTVTTAINIQEGLDVVAGLSFDLATSPSSEEYTIAGKTFTTSSNDGRDAQTDKLYVGFASADFGTITFGRQTLIADDDGIGKDYELGYGQYMSNQIETADEVVKYVYDNGQYYFGISHDLKAQHDNTAGAYDATDTVSVLDGRVGARFAGVDARLYVYTDEDVVNDYETSAYNLEVEYALNEAVNLAASYGEADVDAKSTGINQSDTKYVEVNGSYTIDKTTYSLGFVRSDEDVKDVTTDNIYANVKQKLHDNVTVYTEVGYAKYDKAGVDNEDIDLAYLVGMEVNF